MVAPVPQPREAFRAVPAEATAAIVVPRTGEHLRASVDFLERLLGPEGAQRFLEETHLPALALELEASRPGALDRAEGVGVFWVRGFEGPVWLLGVAEGDRALEVAGGLLAQRGAREEPAERGTRRYRLKSQRDLTLFLDRGYLFCAVQDPEQGEGNGGLARVTEVVRRGPESGLAGVGAVARMRERLAPAVAYVFLAPAPQKERDSKLGGLLAGLSVTERGIELDGVVEAGGPLWSREDSPPVRLEALPAGPVVALFASAPAKALRGFVGAGSSSSEAVRDLLPSLRGDVFGAIYFDPESFLRELAEGVDNPVPTGNLIAELGIADPAAFDRVASRILSRAQIRFERTVEQGKVTYRGAAERHRVELTLSGERARLSVGSGIGGRPLVDFAAEARKRFGAGPFSVGHLTLLVDLRRLREELEVPREVEGIDPRRMVVVQGMASYFLQQMTPVEEVLLDVAPDPGGARLRGRLTLRSPP